jgi:arsenate reductase
LAIRIYHNALCSKSRSACALLQERGLEAEVVNYLETPPSREELKALLAMLGLPAEALVRKGEAVFQAEYLGKVLGEEEWLDALLAHPILMERPIAVSGGRAVIGRPPERVLELL